VHLNLGRRAVLGAAATLLSALAARNSARAEDVELHSPDSIVPVTPPAALPDMNLHTLAGADVVLKAYFGKPMVLNFWATWCVPCVAELPELDRLAATPDMTVLAISADRTGAAAIEPFLRKHPLTHAVLLLDPASDAVHAVQIVGFPTTLIIDAGGRLRGRMEGPVQWSVAAAAVRRLTA
jgi:thiol-disulfide isomerase/thioredoxin